MQAWEYALELRAELEQWWASEVGEIFGRGWGATRSRKSQGTFLALAIREVELSKLAIAPAFFITDEMTDLVEHAAKTFPNTVLHPNDVPTGEGFALFGRSIDVIDVHLRPLPFRAITWKLIGSDPAQGIHLALYTHREDDSQRTEMEALHRRTAQQGRGFPTLSLIHDTTWRYGENYADPEEWGPATYVTEGDQIPQQALDSGVEMMKTIHCFWMLCQQRIGEPRSEQASRGTRRRIERIFPNRPIPDVRVITLRRKRIPAHANEEGNGGREYTHRWWVDGHWRRQWYPSENRHKPRYIEGYVKGPDDKPFIPKDRAYIWRR